MIIGITGTDGAGKGTVVDHLVKNKGFKLYHARTLILEEIGRRGLPANRATMRLVGNDLRRLHGNDYIVRFFLERAQAAGDNRIVIDSLRAVAEAETLKKGGGILLALDADQKLRYERVQKRRSETDKVSFEEFQRHEELEANDPDPHGMKKRAVMAMADYIIYNNNDTAALFAAVDELLAKIDGESRP